MIPILLTAGRFLVNTLFVAGTVAAVVEFFRSPDEKEKLLQTASAAENVPLTEAKQLRAAVAYDRMEQDGLSPDTFWAQAPQQVKDSLEYSPASLRRSMERTEFLGMADALLSTAGAALGLFTVFRGMPIGLKSLARVAEIRKGPHTAADVANIFEEFKVTSITKLGLPGFMAAILGAAGWKAGSWANNINDPDLWGRIQLMQLEGDIARGKMFLPSTGGSSSGGSSGSSFQNTITQTKTAKPKMFLGIVYAGRVVDTPDFVRVEDDEITSDEDLRNDISTNLTKWLATIGDRMNYEIQVKYQPFDEFNVKKNGTWLTLSLYYSGKGGKRIFVDEILLGPFDPVVYYPVSQVSESIRAAANAALQPDILKPTFGTNGALQVVTKEGESISLFPNGGAGSPTSPAPATPTVPTAGSREVTIANPVPVQHMYPTDGMFRTVGNIGDSVFRRLNNRVYQASLFTTDLVPGYGTIVGSGEVARLAKLGLKEKYGIDFDALPVFNLGDLSQDRTIIRTGRAGPDGGQDPFITVVSLQELLALVPPKAASSDPGLRVTVDQSRAVDISVAQASGGLSIPTIGGERRVNTPGSVLNMRDKPSLSGAIVAVLPHQGRFVPALISQPVFADGYTWQFGTYGVYSGFVATEFLQ